MDFNLMPLGQVIRSYDEDYVKNMLQSYHDCIGSDQERFLKENSIVMEKKDMCRTYLAIDKDDVTSILGYVSIGLRCLSVPDETSLSKSFSKRMNIDPDTKVAQSYLIGQLSRSKDAPPGLGRSILTDALNLFFSAKKIVGCRLVRVDCSDDLREYYRDMGFNWVMRNKGKDLNQMVYILSSPDGTV